MPRLLARRTLVAGLRVRTARVMGGVGARWFCPHVDDGAGTFGAASERPRVGVGHAVDDKSARVRDFRQGLDHTVRERHVSGFAERRL